MDTQVQVRMRSCDKLAVLKSTGSCLSTLLTIDYRRPDSFLFSRHQRWAAHQLFIYQPIRVPDSVNFGCPAPRLGLDLASLSSALLRVAASLCSDSISVCSGKLDFEVQFPRFTRTSTVPANPLVYLKYPVS